MKKARRITFLQLVTILVTSCLIALMQGVHSVTALVTLVCITSATSIVFITEVFERVPLFAKVTGFAKHIESISKGRWPRRPHERMTDWYNRVIEAQNEIFDAEWAFVEAAMHEGHMVTVPGRVEQWMLPPTHPAAIRLAKARNEPIMAVNSPYRGAVN
jgi:hypothetical protein